MKIKNFEVSVPIFLYKNKVTHFFSRSPVAIEWAIVESINRFSEDDVFKNTTIKMFFENILKVPDIDQLVKPYIYDLIELGIIEYIDESEEIDCICIKDIHLTQLGKNLIKEGKLPSKDVEDLLDIIYSPFDKSILKSGVKFLQEEKSSITIELNEKYYPYPKNEILEHIDKNKNKISWLEKNSHIKDVEPLKVTQKYKCEKGNVVIHESGILDLEFNNTIYKEYIEKNIDIYEILNSIGLVDNQISCTNIKDSKEVIEKIESFIDEKIIQDKINNYVAKNKVNIIRKINEINTEEVINKFKYSNISNTILMVIDKEIEKSKVDIFEKNKILMYINNENIIDEEIIYINDKGENLCISDIKGKYKEDELYITVTYSYKINLYSNEIIKNIEAALEKIAIDNIEVLIAKGIWTKSNLIFNSIVDVINKMDIHVKEKIQYLLLYKEKIQQIYDVKNLQWKDIILKICVDYISTNVIDTNEKLSQILSDLKLDRIINNRENSDKILSILIPKIQYLDTVKELEDFYLELEKVNINKNSIKDIAIKYNIYTYDIINELKIRFEENDFINKLKSYTVIEEKIKDLKDVENKLKKHMKIESLTTFYKLEDFDNISRVVKLRDIKGMVDRWNTKLEELNNALVTYENINLETPVDTINKNINEFFAFINKVTIEIPNGFEKVYVLDTNVFIHEPDILSYFKKSDYIVVPKKVIEELDNLKFKKPYLRIEINKAIECINERFKERRLIFEESDTELLPIEYEATPDNMILSVAIKYRNFNTTLISSDKMFITRANSEGIDNIDLKTFLECV